MIRIFVFEDDWMCREAIQSVIDRIDGLQIVGMAPNAENVLANVVDLAPDVILMDIRLQGKINGIEATQALNRQCPSARIIIFTSFPDAETLNAAIVAGAAGYLLKEETGNPDVLIKAIREVAKGNAFMTPRISAEILKVIRSRDQSNGFNFTRRELEILKLIAEGLNNRDIAGELNIQERTVANHISNILYKANAKNRTEAVCIARKHCLI